MLKKITIGAALAAAPLLWAAPAFAQTAQPGVVLIYGKDKCPTNENGDEIVVCRRLDEAERFRIPQDLREADVKPQNESWAVRSQDALTAGQTGIGSCSAVGVGGATGCFG
ncbi:MAG: hypothetical protein ACAH11_09220, partial [Sphingomonas sp.]